MEASKKKTGFIIAGIAGTLALITIIVVAVSKSNKNKPSDESGNTDGQGNETTPKQSWLGTLFNIGKDVANSLKGTAPAGTSWKVLEFDEKTSGATDLVVTFQSPRPERGIIASNDPVQLSGMGKFDGNYRVWYDKGIWYDSSDKIGAIYIKSNKATQNKTYKVFISAVAGVPSIFPNAKVTKL